MMTDRAMTKPIRGRQLSKRDLYDEDLFRTHFAKQEIESRLVFLLKYVHSLVELHVKAKELNLTIELKQKNVLFTLEETQEKIATLNKMAKVLINLKSEDHETRKLAKYDFAQMNMAESITLNQLNTDILKLQQELGNEINEYEEIARRLDSFVKIINTNKFTVLKFHAPY